MDAINSSIAPPLSHVMKKRVTKEEWEALGLEKRTDYENLRRVFERISGRVKLSGWQYDCSASD